MMHQVRGLKKDRTQRQKVGKHLNYKKVIGKVLQSKSGLTRVIIDVRECEGGFMQFHAKTKIS